MKIVVAWSPPRDYAEALAVPGAQVRWVGTVEDLAREVADADGLVTSGSRYRVPEVAALVKAAPRLRWVQAAAVGVDPFLAQGLPPRAVLTNARGAFGQVVAEHAMALLLALGRQLMEMERARPQRAWPQRELEARAVSLEGKLIAIVGYGAIGREIARKARAFVMRGVGVRRRPAPDEFADEVVGMPALRRVVVEADVLALALPVAPQTRRLIGRAELQVMKRTAVLINVGRGAVVDEAALIEALREGWIAGAGLDVFEEEPLPPGSPLWDLPNVVISPHLGGDSDVQPAKLAALVRRNIERFVAGQPLENVIAGPGAV
ncbi:MAG: D-2-hydroxyacid dehydrogenase [Armatimonadetes bacterium]|nr:D-2-hydroxyacid dehydrogenase [Armatimonadota bacterium]